MLKRALVVLALLHAAWVLWLRWGTPLNSPHAFRETETAISAYYMLHGGHFLPYWTPVLGPPWTIQFEFPTFQWVVAGVAYVGGFNLDNAGRLVAFCFGICGLVPLRRLCRAHAVDPDVCSALYLAAPLYAFWNTTFLIETCSLFLCLIFLWMVEEERWGWAFCLSVIAAVTKVTTAVPFMVLASILALWKPTKLWTCAVVCAGLCAALVWNHYTDALKAHNPLSAVLVSSQPAQKLHDWGTMQQRLSVGRVEDIWQTAKAVF